jgi:hypothetical protein
MDGLWRIWSVQAMHFSLAGLVFKIGVVSSWSVWSTAGMWPGRPVVMPNMVVFHDDIGVFISVFDRSPWWRGVDDVNDRPVGNPKRRFDEHSNKFSLSKKSRFNHPIGKSQTPEGDTC